jgi:L-fuconolactonase
MRLDAHQHFWKYSPAEYEWITDEMEALKRDYLPCDLKPLLGASGFDGSIAVQARQSTEETRWLVELAEQNNFIRGVVGWVDLCSPTVRGQLEELRETKRLVGIRHVLQGEPDDEFMLRPEFRRGIGQLAEFGLVYDLLLYPHHLPVAVKLVREFPGQRFVLDHIAKPRIDAQVIEPWNQDISELARFPNVSCKLSGMVTEARWNRWTADDFRPYLDVVLEEFGASRLMIGSDWPVCTVSSDYASTMKIVTDYIAQLTTDEREGILGENCARIYGIPRQQHRT